MTKILFLKNIITRCCIVLILLWGCFSCSFGQYKGGNNGGFSLIRSYSQNSLFNIYKGGAEDGFGRVLEVSQNTLSNIYSGGADDGFGSTIQLSQNTLNNIYNGGSDDGFGRALQLSQNTLNNIYTGGPDDGFGRVLQLSQNIFNNIYKGGTDDGFGKMLQLSQNPLNNIYNGGINDGYATIIVPGQNPLNALPLKLLEFSGKWQQQDIVLRWRTANEENLDHFELERRSDNASQFETIGTVAATGFNGNEQEYSFTDKKLHEGTVFYYRLKSVDKDGAFAYSAILRFTRTDKTKIYSVYPNPGLGLFTIAIYGESNFSKYSYRVLNSLGAVVAAGKITGPGNLVDITHQAAGNYYVQIIAGQQIETTYKIIVQH